MSDLDEMCEQMKCADCSLSLLRDMQPFLSKTSFPINDTDVICAPCMRTRVGIIKEKFGKQQREEAQDGFTGDW